MTSRNLNQTWRDVVFKQYEADYAADVPFPVSYLINASNWNRDIVIEIPVKIDPPVFRRDVLTFCADRRRDDDPAYESDTIKVRARVRPLTATEDDAPPQHDAVQPGPGADGGDRG